MISIDFSAAEKKQILKGFGTSACWWSQNIACSKAAETLSDLLYTDKGLNLNIYRYNIGAGWDENNCRVSNPWRKCESFYICDDNNEDEFYHGGGYDWERDKNAYHFMKLCLKKGHIDTVILFANSPHYAFTSSGQASGSLMHHTCNLPKSNYKKFADYFLDIAEHFIEDGVPVTHISPINEPQWKWGGRDVWQEGCHYEPEEVAEVFHAFARAIEERKLNILLYGPESGEIAGLTNQYLQLFLKDELIMKHLGAFAIHSYHSDWDIQVRKDFYKGTVLKHPDIRFDMSEWCELPCKSDTKSINGALNTARVIGWDLSELGAESWTSWVAVNQIADKHGDGKDYSDGLLSASDGFHCYYICKRYYAMLHFTKFLPIDSVVLKTETNTEKSISIFTFSTPENEEIIVAVNEGNSVYAEIKSDCTNMQIYCTTQDSDFKKEYDGEFKSSILFKEKSITTVKLWK